jgi:hypothetical protein
MDCASDSRLVAGQAEECRADALPIPGDPFDSANPPARAHAMSYRVVVGARRRVPRLQTVLIGGNHDSARYLCRDLFIGPNVQLYTATHSTDYISRHRWDTVCKPILVEDDVWIGGNVLINPGAPCTPLGRPDPPVGLVSGRAGLDGT